jgi:hypothetical protein
MHNPAHSKLVHSSYMQLIRIAAPNRAVAHTQMHRMHNSAADNSHGWWLQPEQPQNYYSTHQPTPAARAMKAHALDACGCAL